METKAKLKQPRVRFGQSDGRTKNYNTNDPLVLILVLGFHSGSLVES